MDILTSIDIALGMIVVYLTFALGVTAINEGLASALNSRAKWLHEGIKSLLARPQADAKADTNLVDGFEQSPFVRALSRLPDPPASSTRFKPWTWPLLKPWTWRWRYRASYISKWTILQGLLDSRSSKGVPLDDLKNISAAAEKLPPDSPARVVILDLIARAEGSLDKFRAMVDEWLGNFEDQVRSWYRQRTQFVLLLISAIVVWIANLDTVAIFRQLGEDGQVRAALVAKALETSPSQEGTSKDAPPLPTWIDMRDLRKAENELKSLQAKAASATGEEREKLDEKIKDQERKVQEEDAKIDSAHADLLADLKGSGLQLGWSDVSFAAMSGSDWILKFLGLLLSTFAVAMGAPFWFDLLQKIASVRSVGLNLAERESRRSSQVRARNNATQSNATQ